MKIKYLGTAAAEAIPALFCQCDLCKKAKQLKGKDLRGRSGMIIDGSLLVDFPPDMLMYVFNFNIDLAKIEDVIITHTHSDHFDPSQIMMRLPNCFCHIKDGKQTINIHGNSETGRVLDYFENFEFGEKIDFVKFYEMTKFNTYKIGDFEVVPFPALHKLNEDAYVYLIKKQNKAMLYLNDTGLLYDEIYEYLEKENIKVDFVSFDCTFGKDPDGGNHMGMPDNKVVKDRLDKIGVTDKNTICYVTHFSHNCGQTHEELSKEAEKYGFKVAYDGLELEF